VSYALMPVSEVPRLSLIIENLKVTGSRPAPGWRFSC